MAVGFKLAHLGRGVRGERVRPSRSPQAASRASGGGFGRPTVRSLLAAAAITTLALGSAGTAAAAPSTAGVYLVQFDGAPLGELHRRRERHRGHQAGAGAKLDRQSWNFQAYREHLRDRRGTCCAAPESTPDGGRDLRHRGQRRRRQADGRRGRPSCAARPASSRCGRTRPSRSTRSAPRGSSALTGPEARGQSQFGDAAHAGEGSHRRRRSTPASGRRAPASRRCPSRGPTPTRSPPSGTASASPVSRRPARTRSPATTS